MSHEEGAPRDRGRLMSLKDRRPRTSTLVLTGLFLAIFALYLWVSPDTTDTASAGPASSPTATHSPTQTPSPTPTPRRTTHSPTPSPTSTSPSPAVSEPSPSPPAASPTASDLTSPAPPGTSAQP
jgi:cytoskeletal protein RodZ